MLIHVTNDVWKPNPFSEMSIEFDKVVGVTAADGKQLWIPSDFNNRVEYTGYRLDQTRALPTPFNYEMNKRLVDFFERVILGGLDKPRSQTPAYDCMSFAWFMDGKLAAGTETSTAMALSKEVLDQKTVVDPTTLRMGQIAILGGIDEYGEHYTDHAMVDLGSQKCLQVFGNRGRIVITSYEDTIELYRSFYSREIPPIPLPKPHGLYVVN